jgi:hypothetical protein
MLQHNYISSSVIIKCVVKIIKIFMFLKLALIINITQKYISCQRDAQFWWDCIFVGAGREVVCRRLKITDARNIL